MPDSSTKKRKPRGSLSKNVILKAAQDLLHDEGIEALSIRKIAKKLGAGPMSIYNHYETKQDIEVDLVADFVKRAHQERPTNGDWKTWLNDTFINIYKATVKEPEYLTLMINSKNIGIASLSIFEDSLACLINAGFTPKKAAFSFHQLLSFTLGAAMLHANLISSANDNHSGENAIDKDTHPYSYQHWEQVHSIMLGSEFSASLTAQISNIHPK